MARTHCLRIVPVARAVLGPALWYCGAPELHCWNPERFGCGPVVVGRLHQKSLPEVWEAISDSCCIQFGLLGQISSRTPMAPYWELNKYYEAYKAGQVGGWLHLRISCRDLSGNSRRKDSTRIWAQVSTSFSYSIIVASEIDIVDWKRQMTVLLRTDVTGGFLGLTAHRAYRATCGS